MDEGIDDRQLGGAVALVREVLARELVGIWLYGSAVLGGLHHASDLDLLVVVRGPTTGDERRQLVAGLLSLSGRGAVPQGRSIELTVVVLDDVRPWRYPPRFELQYGEWLRDRLEQRDVAAAVPPGPHPDVAILLTAALQGNRRLAGPPLAEVVEPVPWPDVVRAMTDELPGLLLDLEPDTANVLLTLARIVATLESRTIVPKDVAAGRILPRLSREAAIALERARDVYLGTAPDEWNGLRDEARAAAAELVGASAQGRGVSRDGSPASGEARRPS